LTDETAVPDNPRTGSGTREVVDQHDIDPVVAAYQVLAGRYASNFTVQWQILGLGLTAQGFVIGASSQLGTGRPFTACLLSIVIITIGCITIVSSLRCHLFAQVDRHKLDDIEGMLLTDAYEALRLTHGSGLRERAAALKSVVAPDGIIRGYQRLWVFRQGGPTRWWVIAESVISLTGAAVPIMGLYGV
jgi:hypothetical protein